MTEIEKVNAICYALIHICRDTGAESLSIAQENVTYKGERLGTWEITVKKMPDSDAVTPL